MAKRKRDVPVLFYVSKDEMELIQQKMYFTGVRTTTSIPRAASSDASCERNVA